MQSSDQQFYVDPNNNMITFRKEGMKFTYRIAGIAIHDGRVILQRATNGTTWFVPGGRAELRETSEESLKREMQEELQTDITIQRLLWVVENFFEEKGVLHHELGLYFLVTFPQGSDLYDVSKTFFAEDAHQEFIFRWLPIATLEEISLYPSFLQQALKSVPDVTKHIIHIDE
jgi:8-oxo-dGTP pyrophosphatase MutT (NUDIX family)